MEADEKELLLQGLDLLIMETDYAITYGSKNKQESRTNKLSKIEELKKKLMDNKLIISS